MRGNQYGRVEENTAGEKHFKNYELKTSTLKRFEFLNKLLNNYNLFCNKFFSKPKKKKKKKKMTALETEDRNKKDHVVKLVVLRSVHHV